eukprot:s1897_g4.t1
MGIPRIPPRHPRACDLLGHRSADGLFVSWLSGCTVLALLAFAQERAPDKGPTSALVLFMVLVCLARPGLYGFELGVLNTEQELSDARHRSAIGAVDSALTSFATLVMYGWGIVLGRPDQFGILVDCSTFFVTLGAVTYILWMLLYHSHRHRRGRFCSGMAVSEYGSLLKHQGRAKAVIQNSGDLGLRYGMV